MFLPGESHGQRSRTGYSPWESQRVRQDSSDLALMQTECAPRAGMTTVHGVPRSQGSEQPGEINGQAWNLKASWCRSTNYVSSGDRRDPEWRLRLCILGGQQPQMGLITPQSWYLRGEAFLPGLGGALWAHSVSCTWLSRFWMVPPFHSHVILPWAPFHSGTVDHQGGWQTSNSPGSLTFCA